MEVANKVPTHLWAIGTMATLWNGYGVYDYLMTQTGNRDHLAKLTDAHRAYLESFPTWMDAAWAFGVWGGLLGSLLLLARSRHSVPAYALSLIGLAAATVNQFILSSPPLEMDATMLAMQVAIWAVAIGLFLYARSMRAKGVLR